LAHHPAGVCPLRADHREFKQRFQVDEQNFAEPNEQALFQALIAAEAGDRAAGSVDDFLNAILTMIPAINRFFDDVLVMAEDERLRCNRLGLLQRIAALATAWQTCHAWKVSRNSQCAAF